MTHVVVVQKSHHFRESFFFSRIIRSSITIWELLPSLIPLPKRLVVVIQNLEEDARDWKGQMFVTSALTSVTALLLCF